MLRARNKNSTLPFNTLLFHTGIKHPTKSDVCGSGQYTEKETGLGGQWKKLRAYICIKASKLLLSSSPKTSPFAKRNINAL